MALEIRLPRSLRNRVVLSAFAVLVTFVSLSILVLDQGYKRNILEKYTEQLQIHLFGLLSITEFEEDEFQITSLFYDQRLDEPDGDLIAIVYDKQENRVWDSLSSKGVQFKKAPVSELGKSRSSILKTTDKRKYLLQSLSVVWDQENGSSQDLTFVIGLRDKTYNQEVLAFRKKLLLSGTAVVIVILVLQSLILLLGFKNFNSIASDLRAISRGEKDRLDGSYPTELQTVSRAINQLIINERAQKDRYQKTLGDLAHSLKTPLSVLQSYSENLENKSIYNEQIERIDQIISYQLQRAVRAAPAFSAKPVDIKATVDEINAALAKVYKNKTINIRVDISEKAQFYGSKNDLMELLGNLLDNAHRLCERNILIDVSSKISKKDNYKLDIKIEDDGAGVAEEDRKFILQRGSRADTLNQGQGIGLAVVVDIINTYQGNIQVGRSRLGGALFHLEFSHTLL